MSRHVTAALARLALIVCSGAILVGFISAAAEGAMQENIYASGCSGDKVELKCPDNHRIAIKRLFYGVKRSWDCQELPRKASCCHASHTDCLINDDTKYPTLNTHCSGHKTCTILVQKVPASISCPSSPYTDYMTVIYDCVPDSDIAMFCSNDVKRGDMLYLSNLEYPSSVQENQADCTCMVRTVGLSQGLNIHSIDVLLAWPEHGTRSCSKELAIRDEQGYRWNIQCGHIGYYGFRTIYTRPVQNVTLTLTSISSKGSAFVWLQAKATNDTEMVEVYCGEPLRQILLRARQEAESRRRNSGDNAVQTSTPSGDEADGQDRNSTRIYAAHNGSMNTNLASIIGGIVAAGFILIAIVIVAIALHCKRVKQAKEKSKQSLNLYPAVTNGEATQLTSYCRYNDYDDDHYITINRSPLKLASLTESELDADGSHDKHNHTNGFITLATAEAHALAVREKEDKESREILAGNGIAGHAQSPSSSAPSFQYPTMSSSSAMDAAYRSNNPPYPPSPPLPPHPLHSAADTVDLPPPPPPTSSAWDSPQHHHHQQQHHHHHTLPHPGASSSARNPQLSDPSYQGQHSLRFARPVGHVYSVDVHQQGHQTLPDHRHNGHGSQQQQQQQHKILVSGPKSPLGKRSKSVTFSQPVAMVTPLPSGSEESVGDGVVVGVGDGVGVVAGDPQFGKGPVMAVVEDSNYDNLNKVVIPDHPLSPTIMLHHPLSPSKASLPPPHPRSPTKPHAVPNHHNYNHHQQQQPHQHHYQQQQQQPQPDSYHGQHPGSPQYHQSPGSPRHYADVIVNGTASLPRSMSTFRSEEDEREEGGRSGRGTADEGSFPLPPPPPPLANGDVYAVVHKRPVPLPVFQPQPQNAQLYETGV